MTTLRQVRVRRRLPGAVLLGFLLTVLVPASPALAEPPSLEGALLSTEQVSYDVACDVDGTSTATFEARGTVTGSAYAGAPFTESGTVTIGVQTATPEWPGAFVGVVTSFSSEFSIEAGATSVTGSRLGVLDPSDLRGACFTFDDSYPFGHSLPANGHVMYFVTSAIYTATIATPSGTYVDSGTAAEVSGFDEFVSSKTPPAYTDYAGPFTHSDGVRVGEPEVPDAQAQIAALADAVATLGLPKGHENKLVKRLEQALKEVGKGKPDKACTKVDEFVKEVGKLAGKKKSPLTTDEAADLTGAAAIVKAALGCA